VASSALARFLRLPRSDRRLLLKSLLTLGAARLFIRILPFRTARRLLTPRPRTDRPRALAPGQVRWAIGVAQRVVPDATCLPQAVAAESILTRAGYPVLLRIGVLKSAAGKFEAHAWVECEGEIVVGQLPGGLGEYAQFPPLPPVWPDSGSPGGQ
jgi:hypothetical protein